MVKNSTGALYTLKHSRAISWVNHLPHEIGCRVESDDKRVDGQYTKVTLDANQGGSLTLKGAAINSRTKIVLVYDYIRLRLKRRWISSMGTIQSNIDFTELYGLSGRPKYFTEVLTISRDPGIINYFETVRAVNDIPNCWVSAIQVRLDKECILVSIFNVDNENYAVFETDTRQGITEFTKKTYSIRIALGFLLGVRIGGEYFVFERGSLADEVSNHFNWGVTAEERSTPLTPIPTNVYGFTRNHQYAERFWPPTKISSSSLSKLVEMIIQNEKFELCVLQICESFNTNLVVRPTIYYVIIEALSNIFHEGAEVKFSSTIIGKDDFSSKFLKPALELLSTLSPDKETLEIMKNSLSRVNVAPNAARLGRMFEALGIELSKNDNKILNYRNSVLHGHHSAIGRLPAHFQKSLDHALLYTSHRLYTLISLYLMRLIGYKGPVLDWVKIEQTQEHDRTNFLIC